MGLEGLACTYSGGGCDVRPILAMVARPLLLTQTVGGALTSRLKRRHREEENRLRVDACGDVSPRQFFPTFLSLSTYFTLEKLPRHSTKEKCHPSIFIEI